MNNFDSDQQRRDLDPKSEHYNQNLHTQQQQYYSPNVMKSPMGLPVNAAMNPQYNPSQSSSTSQMNGYAFSSPVINQSSRSTYPTGSLSQGASTQQRPVIGSNQPSGPMQGVSQPMGVSSQLRKPSPYSVPKPLMQVAKAPTGQPGMNMLPPSLSNRYLTTTTTSSSPGQSPGQSAPQSAKSSRNPSPISNTRYDIMEGQFSPYSNSLETQNLSQVNGKPVNAANSFPVVGPTQSNSYRPMTVPPRNVHPVPSTPGQFNNLPPTSTYPSNSVPQQPRGFMYNGPPRLQQNVRPPLPLSENVSNVSSAVSSMPPGPGFGIPRRQYPQMTGYNQPLPAQPGQPQMTQPIMAQPPASQFSAPGNVQSDRLHANASGYQNTAQQPGISTSYPGNQPVSTNYSSQLKHPSSANQGYSGRNFASSEGQTLASRIGNMNLYGGSEGFNIMQNKNVLPDTKFPAPRPPIPNQQSNVSPDVLRCTLNSLPETQSLLQKCRLPLGILIHPFKDLSQLPVIQCSTIVRCRTCRTYINPFIYFVDQKRWKCNLCYRVNELPEEFMYDPVTKTYGDPSRRPEIKSATMEFIAPSEYMLRPPQPAVYLYLLDVSRSAISTGYLDIFCRTLLSELDNIPGDSRTQIGFITYDSCVHFYNLSEGLSQPQMLIISDIEDVFIPLPDGLMSNIHESKELIRDLLTILPSKFADTHETQCALGSALQAAHKLISSTGGRVTVMQTCLPSVGPGSLKSREDPNQRAAKDIQNLGPANDFYKKLSLDCSGQQIAVDLFVLSSQYTDIATLSGISKFSGGSIYHYPGFQATENQSECLHYENDLKRYVTRKIGFEAVMRVRCTRGISIHTFHGNFFVRSTDLLSLPNINPDAAFGMHMSIDESLTDSKTACFQSALLYTSSKGERRIRVHTLCLPVTTSITDVIANADQQAIASLVAKMAVDRSLTASLEDAREALVNVIIDALSAFQNMSSTQLGGAVMVPMSLRLLPLYLLGILKSVSFRIGTSTKLDERVYAMNQLKTLPLQYLIQNVYPDMYPVHALETYKKIVHEEKDIAQPPLLHLSSEKTDRHGVYFLDAGHSMYLYVCSAVSDHFCRTILNVPCFSAVPENVFDLPELETPESVRLRTFISYLRSQRPFYCSFRVIRDDSKTKFLFLQHIIEDRSESTYSYYEFLQHIQQQLTN